MQRVKFILLLPLLLILSGCWDSEENERMFYVHAVGVDFVDGEYVVYLQIINFSNVAKSEQATREENQSVVNSAKGKSVDEAIFKLYNSIDEKVYWGHLSFIIFTEEALKQGTLNSALNLLTRYVDTRYNVWVYSTKSSLNELLNIPTLLKRAITLTKAADPLNSYEKNSYIAPVNMRKLILKLNEPCYETYIPFLKINDGWKSLTDSAKSIEIEGVTLINHKTYKGSLEGEKIKGLQWMTNETKRSGLVTEIPNKENEYMTIVITGYQVKVEPIVKNGHVKFDINIQCNAFLNAFSDSVTPEIVKKGVEKQIKKEILTTYTEALEMDIDIYRFSEKLYRKDLKAWKKLSSNGKLNLTEDSIGNIHITVNKVASGRKDFKNTLDNVK